MRRGDERGQALPLVLVIMAVAMGAALLLGQLGRRALAESRAQTAADAAALAGAAEGPGAAHALARVNGATSVAVEGTVGDATAHVRVGEAEAVARARVRPSPPEGPAARSPARPEAAGPCLSATPYTSICAGGHWSRRGRRVDPRGR